MVQGNKSLRWISRLTHLRFPGEGTRGPTRGMMYQAVMLANCKLHLFHRRKPFCTTNLSVHTILMVKKLVDELIWRTSSLLTTNFHTFQMVLSPNFFEHQGYPDSPTRGYHTGHQQPLAKMPKELTCEGRACAKESKIFFRDFLWTTRQKVHL